MCDILCLIMNSIVTIIQILGLFWLCLLSRVRESGLAVCSKLGSCLAVASRIPLLAVRLVPYAAAHLSALLAAENEHRAGDVPANFPLSRQQSPELLNLLSGA